MNPNFKHIVKKLTLGSHKGGTPFPALGSEDSTKKKKKKSREQAYKDRDMNLYGDLSPSEFKVESDRQNAGGAVPKEKMKGSNSKKSGKDFTKTFLDMAQPASDKIAKRQRQSQIKGKLSEIASNVKKEIADEKNKAEFDNKTIKDHRADKKSTRDKFRGSGKTDADKLEKIRSLGESKRGIRNIKENKKVAKLAARKGISEDDARKLRSERKQKGRDFWRNFASQVTRGVNVAGKGNFDANKSNTDFRKEATRKAQEERSKSPEKIEKETGEQLQYDSYINKFGYATDHDNKNIQNAGFKQGSFSPKDYIPEWNTNKSPEQEYFDNWKASSPYNKLDGEEDSTPQTAMNKIYKQKRGY